MADFTLQELKAIQAEYLEAQAKGIPISEDLAKRYKDAAIGIKNYSAQLEGSLKNFGSSLLSSLVSSERGASKYNNALMAGADAFSDWAMRFGPLGKAAGVATKGILAFAGAVTKQADALYKSYQDLSQAGVTGAAGITGVFKNLQDFGFTVDKIGEYTSLLQNNSDIMIRFGNTANEGASRMADVTKAIRDSGTGKNLRMLGMSTEAIASSTLNFARLQTSLGQSRNLNDQELIEGGARYAEELIKASKLTGASTEKLQDLDQKVAKHAQMGSYLYIQREKAYASGNREAIEAYKQEERDIFQLHRLIHEQLGPDVAEAALSLRSGGPASEKAISALMTSPLLYEALRNKTATAADAVAAFKKDTKLRGKQIATIRMAQGEASKFLNTETMAKAQTASLNKEAEKAANEEMTVTDKAVDSLTDLDISQLNITQALDKLVNFGINPVTSVLQSLTSTISFLLDPFGRRATQGAKAANTENVAASQAGDTTSAMNAGAAAQLTKEEQAKYSVNAQGVPVKGKAATPATPAVGNATQGSATPSAPTESSTPAGPKTPASSSMPSAAMGGILSGPRSGYTATLHGTEAVVPLPDGRTIPVDMPDLSGVLNDQSALLSDVVSTLDGIVKNMKTQVDVSKKILMKQV